MKKPFFSYWRTAEWQTRRTPEKCFLFLRFENLFLASLLDFLCSICTEKNKKNLFNFERTGNVHGGRPSSSF